LGTQESLGKLKKAESQPKADRILSSFLKSLFKKGLFGKEENNLQGSFLLVNIFTMTNVNQNNLIWRTKLKNNPPISGDSEGI